MAYTAPNGDRYTSRHRFEEATRIGVALHVLFCLECDTALDDPEHGRYRRTGCEYCSAACRARAWRKARARGSE